MTTDDNPDDVKKTDGPAAPEEEKLDDFSTEAEAQDAVHELQRDLERVAVREYQKMAEDLRWEVLDFLDRHPDMKVREVADHFGIKEGTIRAWKAHQTMGTYQSRKDTYQKLARPKEPRDKTQGELFESKVKSYLERKRYATFIHFFDKTPQGIVCPHFWILAHANGCPHECQYCYLNLTLRHFPEPTVFSNTARMFQELREWLMAEDSHQVINAGELSDALAWDDSTQLTLNLVPLFYEQKRHKLLLLTKSVNIGGLREMEPCSQVIVSFSVNAPEVANRYEKKSPGPLARLKAAAELKALGWPVRIRIDPVIPIEDWRMHYEPVIDAVNEIGPEVVTLGSLRFFRTLLNHARYGTDVFKYGVDNHDPDDRMRLPAAQRVEIYSYFRKKLDTLRVGLCKETEEVHKQIGLPGVNQSCNCTYE